MPFQKSDFFKTPHKSKIVWKFMAIDKFMSMLHESALYFPNVYSFKDTTEGLLSKKSDQEAQKINLLKQKNLIEHDDSNKDFRQLKESMIGSSSLVKHDSFSLKYEHSFRALLINFSNHLMFCNSWFEKDRLSPAMWAEYGGKNPTSIAIATTIEDLKQSFGLTDYSIHIGKIKYIDYDTKHIGGYKKLSSKDLSNHKTVLKLFYAPIMHKSYIYDDEHEVRAVISFESICNKHLDRVYTSQIPFYTDRLFEEFSIFNMNKTNKMKNMRDIRKGIEIKTDLNKLIRVVLTSPDANDYFKDPLRQLMKTYNVTEAKVL